MEFNRNKLIFWIIWGIILVSIIFLLLMLTANKDWSTNSSNWAVNIWFVWENFATSDLITSFKELYPAHKNKTVNIEIFPNFEDYTYALASAINSWIWPDIFVLNNNEKYSIFSNQVAWISSSVVSPNDFRKRYKLFFSDDLIETYSDDSGTKEHLIWMPVWYETLWVYYNFQKVKKWDLENLSSLNNAIASLKNANKWAIPIWIWNWETVYDSADIVTQFFMLNWAKSIREVTWNALKEWLASYLSYGDVSGINWYNSKSVELKSTSKNSISLFIKWEVYMVVWYPNLVNRIKEGWWFSKGFLQVAPFPHSFSGGGDTLVNYNYFVINKTTANMDFAQDFMAYLYSDNWATKFLSLYPYYLPWIIGLEESILSNKIAPNDFNIELKDFYDDSYNLSSFDKWIKNVYDEKIKLFLDNTNYQEDLFNKLRESIVCKTDKVTSFQNLWAKCD
jgi:hypothetical protein